MPPVKSHFRREPTDAQRASKLVRYFNDPSADPDCARCGHEYSDHFLEGEGDETVIKDGANCVYTYCDCPKFVRSRPTQRCAECGHELYAIVYRHGARREVLDL